MLKEELINLGICIDNEWLDKYCDLINNNLNTGYKNTITQKHHIIPQYYYNKNNIKVDNSDSNLVNLIYKDHILAHYYLMLCSKTIEFKSNNIWAMRLIFGDNFNESTNINEINLDLYQVAYEECRQLMYEKTHTLDACKKIQNKLTGKQSPVKGKSWKKPKKSRKNPNAKNKHLSDLASKRTGEKNPFYGKTHSDETRKIFRDLKRMPVAMLDYETKEIIKTFESAKDAGLYLVDNNLTTNYSSGSRILDVCKKYDLKYHAYGYSWKFIDKV